MWFVFASLGGERDNMDGLGVVGYTGLGVLGGSRHVRWRGGDAVCVTGAI